MLEWGVIGTVISYWEEHCKGTADEEILLDKNG